MLMQHQLLLKAEVFRSLCYFSLNLSSKFTVQLCNDVAFQSVDVLGLAMILVTVFVLVVACISHEYRL